MKATHLVVLTLNRVGLNFKNAALYFGKVDQIFSLHQFRGGCHLSVQTDAGSKAVSRTFYFLKS
jgi:hypothetical protein